MKLKGGEKWERERTEDRTSFFWERKNGSNGEDRENEEGADGGAPGRENDRVVDIQITKEGKRVFVPVGFGSNRICDGEFERGVSVLR